MEKKAVLKGFFYIFQDFFNLTLLLVDYYPKYFKKSTQNKMFTVVSDKSRFL